MIKNTLSSLVVFAGLSALLMSCSAGKDAGVDGFQVEPGFSLVRVAAEPLVIDPVDMAFDDRGDADVLEMPGYPFEDKQSRVKLLHDANQDGVYDSSSVFAENLQLASSIMAYRKGLLVAAPPYLLHVRDTDSDRKADKVDTLMGGFSTGNLQHNYNGLNWGLDNYIYAVNGGNSGNPYWWPDSVNSVNIRGRDFRFSLKESNGRLVPGDFDVIGASSQGYELAIDSYGRLFETHNMEHISHLVFPDRYRGNTRLLQDNSLDIISDHEENGTARIYPIGEQESRVNHPEQSGYFSGSCGVTVYDGGNFGAEYDNSVWVADVVLNLLHADKISADGSTLKASRVLDQRDFLASTDRAFRPVNMTVGPDGSLFVLDFHRKVIEHPEWIPDDIEKTLDLEAGKDQGRIYRISRTASKPLVFSKEILASADGQVDALSHQNQWVARTAHRLLMEGEISDKQHDKLTQLIQNSNSKAKVRALWILAGKEKLKPEQVVAALSDPESVVRENALVISEGMMAQDPKVMAAVLAALSDNDQRVRMQASLSLSLLPDDLFQSGKDRIMEALAGCAKKPADTWNVAALTLAARRAPDQLFGLLVAENGLPAKGSMLASLAQVAAADETKAGRVIEFLAANASLTPSIRANVLKQLVGSLPGGLSAKGWEASLSAIEADNDPGVVSAAAMLRQKTGLPPSSGFAALSKRALAILQDKNQPDSIRAAQISLVSLLPFRETQDMWYACLQNTQPLAIQEGALRKLADQEDVSVGKRLVSIWPELGPQARRHTSDLLLYKEIHHDALLTGLEKGVINIGEMNFDLERRRQLLRWTDNEDTKRRAARLFTDSGVTTRQQAIASMTDALSLKGSGKNGSVVFQNVCSNCHKFGEAGQEVGPLLTEISRKSKESIMHEILDPNSAVDPRYINHRVDTRDGKVHTGIVEKETDEYVTLRKMGGEQVTLYKKEISRFVSLGTSLMMEGLESTMSKQEMADLLAYLTLQP